MCYSPPLLAGFRCRWWCAVPRHSWLGSAGGGGAWCVVCGVWCAAVVCWWGCGWCVVWLVPRHSWRRFLCATPRHSWLGFAAGGGRRSSPLLAEGPGRGSPPLLAGFRCRQWCVVCGLCCVICGVRRWCVGGVEAGVWCGWSLANPGGGSCVLRPATPGGASLPVVVGGPRHSWLRVPGAVPRHSWLGSAGGGGVWWGCGWCVVWLVPRHSWRRFLCATPRHSWLGFAAGGGVRFPATPGWGLLAAVVCGVWCVVCGVWCAAVVCWWGFRLVCGVVGPSPLLAEVPVCYSPPLLAGFRYRWWWAFLATPGGGSRALFPATPGWVSLSAVVCGVWCEAVVCWWGCGWCVVWLVSRHSRRRFLCATPRHSWLGFAAGGGGRSSQLLAEGPGRGSPPLLAGVRWRRWCVVGLWLVCGVVGLSPLLAEVPVCYSPPLLAGFRCRSWWAVLATPG